MSKCTLKRFENILEVFNIKFIKGFRRIRNGNHVVVLAENNHIIPDFKIINSSDIEWIIFYYEKFQGEMEGIYD